MTSCMRRWRMTVLIASLGVVVQVPACQLETVQTFGQDFLRALLAAVLV